MLADELARLEIVVSGRVQGVFFRRATVDEALRLGVGGWVRNRPDGAVEIVAEGKRGNHERMLAWAHSGPPRARVEAVRERWGDYQGEFTGFIMA
jgi:acylphosphatase